MIRKKAAPLPGAKPAPLEAALTAILADHFELCENPHQTIYRIALLLDAQTRVDSALEPTHCPGRIGPTYN